MDAKPSYQGEERRSFGHIEKKLDDITASIESIKEAFPDGDIVGHRKYHEAKIKAAVAEEEFWKDLKLDVAKKGAWGLIMILIGLVMLGVSAKIGAINKVL